MAWSIHIPVSKPLKGGGGMETESALKHGLLLFNKGINYTFELLITIRIGMEMLF